MSIVAYADPNCLFCKIIGGQMPAKLVYQDALIVVVRDKHPRSPSHLLLMPRKHIRSAAELGSRTTDAQLLTRIFTVAADIARLEHFFDGGYRMTTNVGKWAGQSIDHLHFHLTGGKPAQ